MSSSWGLGVQMVHGAAVTGNCCRAGLRPRCSRGRFSSPCSPQPSRHPAAVLGMAPSVWGVSSLHSGVPIVVLRTPVVSWAVQHRELLFRSSDRPDCRKEPFLALLCVAVTVPGWKPGRMPL